MNRGAVKSTTLYSIAATIANVVGGAFRTGRRPDEGMDALCSCNLLQPMGDEKTDAPQPTLQHIRKSAMRELPNEATKKAHLSLQEKPINPVLTPRRGAMACY